MIINKLENGVKAMIQSDKKTNNNIGFMKVGPFLTKLTIPEAITLKIAEKGIIIEGNDNIDRIPWNDILRVYTEKGFVKQSGVFIELINGSKLRVYNINTGFLKSLNDKDVAYILNSKAIGKIDNAWEAENNNPNEIKNTNICPFCNHENTKESNFCSSCGTKLNNK